MGLAKKLEWFKWIRKYSTGILDTKTSSMETLIDSASSKTINYAYASSVITDDEFINAAAAVLPHNRQRQKRQQQQQQQQQRPMLPPPASATAQDSPLPQPSPANDVYDCCVSLDGIPVHQEFQYTLCDTDGCGTVTKHDIEGLASKILESVCGTTLKFSSRGQRTVKVTLNIRQTAKQQTAVGTAPKQLQRVTGGRELSKKHHYGRTSQQYAAGVEIQPAAAKQRTAGCTVYGSGIKGVSASHHNRIIKYRREQLIEMVQRSLAENLSFQNQRKPSKPEASYHRPRKKRRQPSCGGSAVPLLQSVNLPSPTTPMKPFIRTPPKVGWSPYDYEPAAHIPSYYHQHHHHQQQQQQQHYYHQHHLNLYDERQLIKNIARRQQRQQQQQQQQLFYGGGGDACKQQTSATQASGRQHYQQQQRAAATIAKKIHHHIHEHHHYHHYDHYIV